MQSAVTEPGAWMEKQAKAEQPFFLWYNSTAMHFRTHLADKNRGKSGQDEYSDRMVTHDEQVGELLKKLDELGIADNTIVMYSSDNSDLADNSDGSRGRSIGCQDRGGLRGFSGRSLRERHRCWVLPRREIEERRNYSLRRFRRLPMVSKSKT